MKRIIAFLILVGVCAFAKDKKDQNRFVLKATVVSDVTPCIIDQSQALASFSGYGLPDSNEIDALESVGQAFKLKRFAVIQPVNAVYTNQQTVSHVEYGQIVTEQQPVIGSRAIVHVVTADKRMCWIVSTSLRHSYLDTLTGNVWAFPVNRRPKHEKDLKDAELISSDEEVLKNGL